MDRREEVCRGRSIATPKKKEGEVVAGAGLGGQGGGGSSRAGGKKVKIRRGGRRVEFIRGYLYTRPGAYQLSICIVWYVYAQAAGPEFDGVRSVA